VARIARGGLGGFSGCRLALLSVKMLAFAWLAV